MEIVFDLLFWVGVVAIVLGFVADRRRKRDRRSDADG